MTGLTSNEPRINRPYGRATGTLHRRVAAHVRRLLAARGMQQRELADATHVHSSHLSHQLAGRTAFGLLDLERIADALQVDVRELLAPIDGDP